MHIKLDILYLQIKRDQMPPKKKKDLTKKDEDAQVQPKAATDEPKKEVKQVKQPAADIKPVEVKKEVKKPEDQKPESPKIVRADSDSQRKINLAQTQKLSQAELLERRRLRFNLVGTEVNAQQAQKISKERMEKFGSSKPQSKEDLEKRRQKFSNTSSLSLDQDPSILEKRKEKFASGGGSGIPADDPQALEERKKKFGSNNVSLDEQINKQKQRRQKFGRDDRHQGRHNNFKRSQPHSNSRGRYDNNNKRFKR